MVAVRVDPGAEPTVVDIVGDLRSMQEVVGGSLEVIHHYQAPRAGRRIVYHCNEDGIKLDLPKNRSYAGTHVHGSILVTAKENAADVDLTDAEVEAVIAAFRRWPPIH
jgi:hypothetical protein